MSKTEHKLIRVQGDPQRGINDRELHSLLTEGWSIQNISATYQHDEHMAGRNTFCYVHLTKEVTQ